MFGRWRMSVTGPATEDCNVKSLGAIAIAAVLHTLLSNYCSCPNYLLYHTNTWWLHPTINSRNSFWMFPVRPQSHVSCATITCNGKNGGDYSFNNLQVFMSHVRHAFFFFLPSSTYRSFLKFPSDHERNIRCIGWVVLPQTLSFHLYLVIRFIVILCKIRELKT